MARFQTQRSVFENPKYVRFLVGFWMYLMTMYLLSLWT